MSAALAFKMHRETTLSYDELVEEHFRSTLPYWEQIYADRSVYGRIYQERARRAIACVDRIGLPSGASVLEIGCGPGVIITAMARKGVTVSAVDTLAEMVERTQAVAHESGVGSRVFAQIGHVEHVPSSTWFSRERNARDWLTSGESKIQPLLIGGRRTWDY